MKIMIDDDYILESDSQNIKVIKVRNTNKEESEGEEIELSETGERKIVLGFFPTVRSSIIFLKEELIKKNEAKNINELLKELDKVEEKIDRIVDRINKLSEEEN